MHKPLRLYLLGTSSVGKSTLLRAFPADEWVTYDIDQQTSEEITGRELAKLPNKFMSDDALDAIYSQAYAKDILKYMRANLTEKRRNFVFADVPDEHPKRLAIHSLPDDFITIIIYASPTTLIRNMSSRMSTQPRGMWVLNVVFPDMYKGGTSSPLKPPGRAVGKPDVLDVIDAPSVKDAIAKDLKWNFTGKGDLDMFVKEMFMNMNIRDNKPHPITYVYPVKYDALIKLDGRSPAVNAKDIIETAKEIAAPKKVRGGDETNPVNLIYICIALVLLWIIFDYIGGRGTKSPSDPPPTKVNQSLDPR